jgi:ATP-dependent exoDNAse (exonuclease V) alpha subunit
MPAVNKRPRGTPAKIARSTACQADRRRDPTPINMKNGRTTWDRNTVVGVDEAAMLDTPVTGELLAAACQAGAKLILAGDDRQLASIG